MKPATLSRPLQLTEESVVFERGRFGWRCRGRNSQGETLTFELEHGDWRECPASRDPRLPLAEATGDPARIAAQFGFDRVHHCRVLSYRPGRRIVLRVSGRRRGRSEEVFLKGVRPRRFPRWRTLHARLGESSLADHLVLPEGASAALCALSFPVAPGAALADPSLEQLHCDGIESMLQAFTAAGRTMRLPLPTRDFEDERNSCLTMLTRAEGIDDLVDSLVHLVSALEPPREGGPVGVVHGDLHDGQIFLSGSSLRSLVIDLDTISTGPMSIDRINLEEHLRLRLQTDHYTEPSVRRTIEAWLEDSPIAENSTWRTLARSRLAAVHIARPATRNWAHALASRLLDELRSRS